MGIKIISYPESEVTSINHILKWNDRISIYKSELFGNILIKPNNWYNAINCGKVEEVNLTPAIKKEVASTGYSASDLAEIELAFEAANLGENEDEWMFNGLLAVYDVLCEIHEIDKEEVEKPELIFVK